MTFLFVFLIVSVIQTILIILNTFLWWKADKAPNTLLCHKVYIPILHIYSTGSYTMDTCIQALRPLSTSDMLIPAEYYMWLTMHNSIYTSHLYELLTYIWLSVIHQSFLVCFYFFFCLHSNSIMYDSNIAMLSYIPFWVSLNFHWFYP